jgi:acetolactate synthase-1/2/3 large subunit
MKPHTSTAWPAAIQMWREECPLAYEKDDKLRAQFVIEKLREQSRGDAIVLSDVGQHQMWTAQYFKFKRPSSHITSGGLGTMGFCLPASIGAAFGMRAMGQSELPVISINGDGGFVMNAQELSVAAAHRLPLKIVVINNRFLGMVRQWQELFHDNRYSHTDLSDTNPDFVKLAEANHCVGIRVTSPGEMDAALEKAWAINDRPVLIECQVEKEEMVFPMVPAGASTGDMITKRFSHDHDV